MSQEIIIMGHIALFGLLQSLRDENSYKATLECLTIFGTRAGTPAIFGVPSTSCPPRANFAIAIRFPRSLPSCHGRRSGGTWYGRIAGDHDAGEFRWLLSRSWNLIGWLGKLYSFCHKRGGRCDGWEGHAYQGVLVSLESLQFGGWARPRRRPNTRDNHGRWLDSVLAKPICRYKYSRYSSSKVANWSPPLKQNNY